MAIALAPLGAQQQASNAFDLNEATIAQLQEGMAAGRYTSRRLVELYLKRIDDIDRGGPALRSISETNPEALAIADALDAERKSKGSRGPLHGIPIVIKDNIDTADRMTTTAGSLALEGSIGASQPRIHGTGTKLPGSSDRSGTRHEPVT